MNDNLSKMGSVSNNAYIYGEQAEKGSISKSREKGPISKSREKGPISKSREKGVLSARNNANGTNTIGQTILKYEPAEISAPHKTQQWNVVMARIEEHAMIFSKALQLTKDSRVHPLQHFDLQSENACDVYITDHVVFKPGTEAALKAKAGYGLLRLIGIERALVASKEGIATVVSREDKDEDGHDILYTVIDLGKEAYLVPTEDLKKMKNVQLESSVQPSKENQSIMCEIEDQWCMLTPTSEGYKLGEVSNGLDDCISVDNAFILVKNLSDEPFLAAEKALLPFDRLNNVQHVELNGTYYKVESDPNDADLAILTAKDGRQIGYQKFMEGGEEEKFLWVAENAFFPFDEEQIQDNEGVYPWEEKEYLVEKEQEIYQFKQTSQNNFIQKHEDDRYAIIRSSQSTYTLVPKDSVDQYLTNAQPLIKERGELFVERNGQKYEAVPDQNGFCIVGKDVKGMVQSKIKNIFTGKKPGVRSKVLDIRQDTPERAGFYARIPMHLFADAFFATLLLRPQDGKISTLDETNVLFSELDPDKEQSSLMPILIDLDETLPDKNDYLTVKKEVGGGVKNVNTVRFGLMGFPHAARQLSPDEKKYVLQMVHSTVAKKEQLIKYLETFTTKGTILKKANQIAFEEVIDRLATFEAAHQDPSVQWSLKDLCFHVLPAFKADWERIGNRLSPEEKALYIGLNSMEEIEQLLHREGHAKPRGKISKQ